MNAIVCVTGCQGGANDVGYALVFHAAIENGSVMDGIVQMTYGENNVSNANAAFKAEVKTQMEAFFGITFSNQDKIFIAGGMVSL